MSNKLSNTRLHTASSQVKPNKQPKQKAKPQPAHVFTPIRSASARKSLCIAIAAIAQTLAGHAYAGPDGGSAF